ncbi:OstA-like protein [Algoriphagus machipongonensis]|uniref:Organic solvent tolerance-like N-terminal domain-containing protein n=1 Tax=Algoriphagus machipongonensis TaxID=388413 RepID=A3HXA9_9BACT|nr:OstA-like protein [Algoriphagus machipongonensis]EAZ81232.2 hypothetical protein ALPR1_19388 [Algoriphagus machipongonensis]
MTKQITRIFLISFLLCQWTVQSMAQEASALNINNAGQLVGAEGFQRLIGDVEMEHQSSLIYCDSAYFYQATNQAKLFGNVRIVDQEDPIQTTSSYAEYDGNTQLAKLRTNVVFTNQETTLYTDYLDYDRAGNIAYYFNDGRVIDSANVLTSEKGRYDVSIERITFQNDVVLVNPDYTLRTNDLVYMTIPKTAETKGLTNLVSKEGNTLDAQKGSFYDTQNKQFRFFDGIVETETSRVKAIELFYDENLGYYEGKEDVRMLNKEREIEIFGEVGKYWEEEKHSLIYGNALVRKYFEADTLYMTADSLISYDREEDSLKYLQAFRDVNLVKADLSGKADSLVYNYNDSSIHLYQEPVMWNQKSQISADSMTFFIANEVLERVFLKDNAFIITQDTILNFNQMKGRKMTGYFSDGQISKMDIEGNGESLYFVLESDTISQGVNRTLSATIQLKFKDGAINRVNYGVKPDGRFIPSQRIDNDNSRLPGFSWRFDERPDMELIHSWRPIQEIDPKAKNLFNSPDIEIRMPTDQEIEEELKKRGVESLKKQN